jgi:hypothetical protein
LLTQNFPMVQMSMTRRQLGKLAAAGSAALLPPTRAGAQNSYSSALDGLADRVDMNAFDPVIYTRKLYESAPLLKLTFRAQNRKQAEVWQKRLRAKIAESGRSGFPAPRAALLPQTLGSRAIFRPTAARSSSSRAGLECSCSATC